jgi:hypothetical protein
MLGGAIAARPLARDGLGLLGSDFGRTRLAEAPLPAWGRAAPRPIEPEPGARTGRQKAAAATRP